MCVVCLRVCFCCPFPKALKRLLLSFLGYSKRFEGLASLSAQNAAQLLLIFRPPPPTEDIAQFVAIPYVQECY